MEEWNRVGERKKSQPPEAGRHRASGARETRRPGDQTSARDKGETLKTFA